MDNNQDPPVLDTYYAVVIAFKDFLTVAIHTILYERGIYPQTSFLKARKYNYPVRQSRHPKVCKWIQDAVAAVEEEMLKCTISSTSLMILAPPPLSTPLERYTFQTSAFPQIPPSEQFIPFEAPLPPTQNLPAQFAATISRLSTLSSALAPLPQDCTFTLVVELRDDIDALLRESQNTWIAADGDMQRRKGEGREGGGLLGGGGKSRDGFLGGEDDGDGEEEVVVKKKDKGKKKEQQQQKQPSFPTTADEPTEPEPKSTIHHHQEKAKRQQNSRTTPIRNIEAGAFVMEVWVEEGPDKAAAIAAQVAEEARLEEERRGGK